MSKQNNFNIGGFDTNKLLYLLIFMLIIFTHLRNLTP